MKTKFKLSGAILSIILGSYIFVGAIITINTLINLLDSGAIIEQLPLVKISSVITLLLASALILFGSFLCAKKDSKGFAITLLVLVSVLTVLQIIGTVKINVILILILIFELSTLAMLIIYLVLAIKEKATKHKEQTAEEFISSLKQLVNSGIIVEKEFKALMIRGLKK